ncbi:aspartate--ammonia ligase [Paenibacillus glacialis]|nr:aspartate--ammonia ligase [Paenibacillus glacialis]
MVLKGFEPAFHLRETEVAIFHLKRFFEQQLAERLHLTHVSTPLFVKAGTGINDNLNGEEQPVTFSARSIPEVAIEIVHSLAKWKRMALARYGCEPHTGLYTIMQAIRKDEELDNLHSIYVDQWDWEQVILKSERTIATLQQVVTDIYEVLKDTELYAATLLPNYITELPKEISFITSQELEDQYPNLSGKEREDVIAKEKGAVFIMQIGHALKSGVKHDGRSPDYDDWQLNGDIIVWNPILERAFEVSSMGIRVDETALLDQLKIAGCEEREQLLFHQAVLQGKLPYSIGGGIGQSRVCMLLLRKAHIGEVQASVWPTEMEKEFSSADIHFL